MKIKQFNEIKICVHSNHSVIPAPSAIAASISFSDLLRAISYKWRPLSRRPA